LRLSDWVPITAQPALADEANNRRPLFEDTLTVASCWKERDRCIVPPPL